MSEPLDFVTALAAKPRPAPDPQPIRGALERAITMPLPVEFIVEFTAIETNRGLLTKRISLSEDGKLKSDGSACLMTSGRAWRVRCASMQDFADYINACKPNQAIALGRLRADLSNVVSVETKSRLGREPSPPPEFIARTQEFIEFRNGAPAFALIDVDVKGMPPEVGAKVEKLGGFWDALKSVLPPLDGAARVMRRSTSAGLVRSDTGDPIAGSGGMHAYVLVKDGADIRRFLGALHERCWLHGFGWMMVGAGGQLLERSIVDRVVGSPERLAFEGSPVLVPPLAQDKERRRPIAVEGDPLDSRRLP
jgi:hypothetical protein